MAEGGDAPQHIQLKVKDQQGSEVGFLKLVPFIECRPK